MQNRWNDDAAARSSADALDLRVYTSRLLGQDEDLVLHGGGNTSVKAEFQTSFGQRIPTLYVKGSGWNLDTIDRPGFAPLRLAETVALAERPTLGDDEMARELRDLLLDHRAPQPSVEAILHAIIPYAWVDHTHADAVVTLSNLKDGEERIHALYSDCLVLPYVMPGFVLARQVQEALQATDLRALGIRGMILLHHGIFSFADDAKTSYDTMISLVQRAEDALATALRARPIASDRRAAAPPMDLRALTRIRKAVSSVRGAAQVALLDESEGARRVAGWPNQEAFLRGPLTPDHIIRTKRIPLLIDRAGAEVQSSAKAFAEAYLQEFEQQKTDGLKALDPAPRFALWQDRGLLSFGASPKEAKIVRDIAAHTARAIEIAEALSGWQALPLRDLFEVEYWVLEQAKLKKGGNAPPHQGKVALVTGAASGIGRATALQLRRDGAIVFALDRDERIQAQAEPDGLIPKRGDVCDEAFLASCVEDAVRQFGGLDLLVANAGIFESGQRIEELRESWDRHLAVNLTSVQRLLAAAIPYLREGVDPAVVLVGSRNVPAPGAGAAAYSVSKAGLTQLGRVAALELAKDGIRVNIVHPDAVFDTGLWTEEALEKSAARYHLSVDEYKRKNLLQREVSSAEVATVISTLLGPVFRAMTGAQIPIDGGSDRVI